MKLHTQEDVGKIISPKRLRNLREKIAPPDAVTKCRLWTGTVTRDGYPKMFVSQRRLRRAATLRADENLREMR